MARCLFLVLDLTGKMQFLACFSPLTKGFRSPKEVTLSYNEMLAYSIKSYFVYNLLKFLLKQLMLLATSAVLLLSLVTAFTDEDSSVLALTCSSVVTIAQVFFVVKFSIAFTNLLINVPAWAVTRFGHVQRSLFRWRQGLFLSRMSLKAILEQYNDVCLFLDASQHFTNISFALVVFWFTPLFAYAFHLTAFSSSRIIQTLAGGAFLNFFVVVAFQNDTAARVAKAAHLPYNLLNSIVAKSKLRLTDKLKVRLLLFLKNSLIL